MTHNELLDKLKGLLGGRAAEETIYGEISTGAENDLERATALARQMVCMYGMSDEVGLAHCARWDGMFARGQNGTLQTDCSPHTAEIIDQQVKELLATAYGEAKQILSDHRDELEAVRASCWNGKHSTQRPSSGFWARDSRLLLHGGSQHCTVFGQPMGVMLLVRSDAGSRFVVIKASQ